MTDTGTNLTQHEIAVWLIENIARTLGVAPQSIARRTPFTQLGLDSAATVALAGELEDWLGRRLDPTLLYDYTTIDSLSRHLAGVLDPNRESSRAAT